MRELWVKIFLTSGARIYSLIAGLIVLTITAHWLGPSGRGEMAAALVWTNLFYICGFLSLNMVAMHLAGNRAREIMDALLGTLAAVAIAVTAAGWVVAYALFRLFRQQLFGEIRGPILLLAFGMLPFLIWEQYGNALLIVTDRLRVYNRAIVISKTLVFVLVGASYFFGFGIYAAVAAMLIGQMMIVAASLPTLLRGIGGGIRFDLGLCRALLVGAAKLHPSTVATFVYAYNGVLVMNRFLGPAQTGIYQFATQLFEVMLVVPYAANIVLYAKSGESGVHEAWPYQRRVLVVVVALMAVAAVVAAVAAPLVIPVIGGRSFAPSIRVFRWVLIALCFATVSTVMTTQWIGRGLFLPLSMLNIGSVLVSLAANLTLTRHYGMNGAIVSLILSYFVTAVANIIFAIRCEWEYQANGARSTIHVGAA